MTRHLYSHSTGLEEVIKDSDSGITYSHYCLIRETSAEELWIGSHRSSHYWSQYRQYYSDMFGILS